MNHESRKLKTYANFKKSIGIAPYLNNVHNIENRTAMTKFRLSNHSLMIEKGRHNNIEAHERFCPFCPNCIEDEYHFLIMCTAYYSGRLRLLEENNIMNTNVTNQNLFISLMTENFAATVQFICNSNYIRNFLMGRHHNVL